MPKSSSAANIKGVFPSEYKISSKETGVFFNNQNVNSLSEAIDYFEMNESFFDKKAIRKNAERFSIERFENEFKETVDKLYNKWKEKQ